MNGNVGTLISELEAAKISYEFIRHPVAYTAQQEAAAAHIPGRSFAKSVIVFADGQPKHLVLPSPQRVDVEAVRRHLGAGDVRLASEEEITGLDRKSTRLNSSHSRASRLPSSA